jgi:adenylosuccinate lyase
MKEIEEPFEKDQIGSSAMAYKRNPMRSERMSSLCRFILVTALNPAITASTQWFERTLDDSANKRITVPEAFLACDGILNLYMNVVSGLVIYEKVINQHVLNELPFMATENILMEAVKAGGDRQELHERIRVHSMEAARMVKQEGKPNDLIDRICEDPAFKLDKEAILSVLEPVNFIGRSHEQVDEFIQDYVVPVIEKNRDQLGANVKIEV